MLTIIFAMFCSERSFAVTISRRFFCVVDTSLAIYEVKLLAVQSGKDCHICKYAKNVCILFVRNLEIKQGKNTKWNSKQQ